MFFGSFTLYNVLGGAPWIFLFTYTGYFFGGVPGVEAHLVPTSLVLLAIGILPLLFGWIRTVWGRSHPRMQHAAIF